MLIDEVGQLIRPLSVVSGGLHDHWRVLQPAPVPIRRTPHRPRQDAGELFLQRGRQVMIAFVRLEIPRELDQLAAPPQAFVDAAEIGQIVGGQPRQEPWPEDERVLVFCGGSNPVRPGHALQCCLCHPLPGLALHRPHQPSTPQGGDVGRAGPALALLEGRVTGRPTDRVEQQVQRRCHHRFSVRAFSKQDDEALFGGAPADAVADQPPQVLGQVGLTHKHLGQERLPPWRQGGGVEVDVHPASHEVGRIVWPELPRLQVDRAIADHEHVVVEVEMVMGPVRQRLRLLQDRLGARR